LNDYKYDIDACIVVEMGGRENIGGGEKIGRRKRKGEGGERDGGGAREEGREKGMVRRKGEREVEREGDSDLLHFIYLFISISSIYLFIRSP